MGNETKIIFFLRKLSVALIFFIFIISLIGSSYWITTYTFQKTAGSDILNAGVVFPGFLLISISMILLQKKNEEFLIPIWKLRIAKYIAVIVILSNLFILIDYSYNFYYLKDRLAFDKIKVFDVSVIRNISPFISMNFIFIGLSLLFLDYKFRNNKLNPMKMKFIEIKGEILRITETSNTLILSNASLSFR